MEWFEELSKARTSNGFGVNSFTYTELQAWAVLTRRVPTPFEVEMLMALDVIERGSMAKQKARHGV